MRIRLAASLVAGMLMITGAARAAEGEAPAEKKEESLPAISLETDVQKWSYAVGAQIGRSLQQDGLTIDVESFSRAIDDVLNGRKSALSDEETAAVMQRFREQMMSKAQEAAGKMRSEGEAFLAANGKKEGVKTLPSGLQYEVIKSGDGPSPKASDVVQTHYRGTLIDGKEFDSSYARNEPAEFPVDGVIPGWTEALQLMHVGDKWRLVIPSDLAYGERGAGGAIPPNSTLVFEVELLKIVEQDNTIAIPK